MVNKFGIKYFKFWLDIIWKKLFDSYVYNGIGVLNLDDVNYDIVVWLISVFWMIDGLINFLKK